MASKTFDEIRRAEAESVNRQRMAQNSADQALKKAHDQAAAIQQEAASSAKAEAQQMRDSVIAECDALLAENQRAAEVLCAELTATADQNRDKVIAMVIDTITDGQT